MISMNIYHLSKKGQSILEFSIIFVAILVAFLFMQTYLRQAISGKLRDTADDIGSLYNPGGGTNIDTKLTLQSAPNQGRYIYTKINLVTNEDYWEVVGGENYEIRHTKTKSDSRERLEGKEGVSFR